MEGRIDPDGTGDAPTIQAGVDSAATLDTVELADGVYMGMGNRDVDLGEKALLVRSANGPEAAIVDCESAGRAFYIHEPGHTVIEGLTIRNGAAERGGGILIGGGEIAGNGQGLVVGTPGPADANARGNRWGDPGGPYHPTLNPQGLGNAVSDHVLFVPWETLTGIASGGPRASFALVAGSPITSVSAITFSLDSAGDAGLLVYDVAGRLVTTLFAGTAGPGATRLFWDGRDDRGVSVASGVYFVRLSTAARSLTHRVVLIH